MTAEKTTENAPVNCIANMQPIGWWARVALFGILLRKDERDTSPPARRVVIWNERDDWIAVCVKMGLNAREIRDLSFSWPQPVTTTQQVYDKIEQLHLTRKYRWAQKKLRSSSHGRNIIFAFSKLSGQALEYQHAVSQVMRDSVPFPGVRFRFDLSLCIDKFLFYVEVQTSKIEGTRWYEKFSNYLKLYRVMRQPFRVLFLVDRGIDVTTLRRRAREVLKDHPTLNLFLFMSIDDFHHQTDVIKAPVWLTPTKTHARLL